MLNWTNRLVNMFELAMADCRRLNFESVEVDWLKPSSCPTQSNWYLLTLFWCQNDRNRSARRHLVIPSATLSIIGVFSRLNFPKVTES